MFWFLVIVTSVLIVYFKFFKSLNYWEERNIPHLKPWPLVGNMGPFTFRQISFYELMGKFYNAFNLRYFGLYNYNQPILVIRDVELTKQICIKDFEHFIDHKIFFNETEEPVFSENLFAATGQKWRELRATLSPSFTGSKMRAMYTLISECSDRFTNHYLKIVQNKPLDVEMRELCKRFTVDVLATCACGIESNSAADANNEFYETVKDIADFAQSKALVSLGYLIIPSVMRLLKIGYFTESQINFFRNIVSTTIAYREKHGIIRPDLIHIMMQARKGQLKYEDSANDNVSGFATVEESDIGKNNSVKLDITDNLIVAQVMIFFIGGIDTSSMLLSLASYELAINTDIQNKLQEEIDATYKECNGHITYDYFAKMKYLDMVVSETLRKWPQAFLLDRLCTKDYTIKAKEPGEKDFVIEKGTSCWFPVVGFHRDPKYFPEPDRFDPERFSDKNKHNINTYAYLPFGQGPRSCIGNRFALLIVKTFLFHILHHFNFIVTKKTDIPLKVAKSQVIFNSVNGYWIGLEKRMSNK